MREQCCNYIWLHCTKHCQWELRILPNHLAMVVLSLRLQTVEDYWPTNWHWFSRAQPQKSRTKRVAVRVAIVYSSMQGFYRALHETSFQFYQASVGWSIPNTRVLFSTEVPGIFPTFPTSWPLAGAHRVGMLRVSLSVSLLWSASVCFGTFLFFLLSTFNSTSI